MNVQLVPQMFVEIPVELADELGIQGGEMVKVTSARATYTAKAMVTRRIKPMTIDGKKVYQIGIPIHQGFRGIQEDAGRVPRSRRESTVAHGNRSECLHARVQGLPCETGEGISHGKRTTCKSKPSPDTPAPSRARTPRAITMSAS